MSGVKPEGRQGRSEPRPLATLLVHRRLDEVRSGSGVYLLGLIDRILAAGFGVRIVIAPIAGFGSLPFSRPAKAFRARGCELVWPRTVRVGPLFVSTSLAVWKRALRRGVELARWSLVRWRRHAMRPVFQSSLGKIPQSAELDSMIVAANEVASAMVVAEYSSLAPALDRCRAKVRAVLLHDLFSLRTESFREVGLPPDHVTVSLATETDWLSAADICLYASAADAERMARRLPDKRHIWLPPRVHVRGGGAFGPPHAVFLGVRHGGNQDALDLILAEIWPRVRCALPEAELWIVGEIGECVQGRPEGVRLIGRIDDPTSIGGPDAIGLAPVRAASGISIKVATYLELGMSVIASSKALEGYAGALDDLVVQADDPAEFSAKLIALLSDARLREETARRGVGTIAARLDDGKFESYLRDLNETSRALLPIA